MTQTEFMLALVCLGALMFTNIGGVGGGGIIVPVMMGLYRFDAKNAVTLSNFSAPCSGVVRYISNISQSHPLKNGKGLLCDYNIISLMLPAAIVGASIGSIVNILLPSPIILAIFIVVTSFTSFTAMAKYCSLRLTE